jgi:hypothetical protein
MLREESVVPDNEMTGTSVYGCLGFVAVDQHVSERSAFLPGCLERRRLLAEAGEVGS